MVTFQDTLSFTRPNGHTYADTATPVFGNLAFIGFSGTAAFTSLTIGNGSDMLLLDFKFGTAAVPEPASVTLLGITSEVLAGCYQWRRRRAAG